MLFSKQHECSNWSTWGGEESWSLVHLWCIYTSSCSPDRKKQDLLWKLSHTEHTEFRCRVQSRSSCPSKNQMLCIMNKALTATIREENTATTWCVSRMSYKVPHKASAALEKPNQPKWETIHKFSIQITYSVFSTALCTMNACTATVTDTDLQFLWPLSYYEHCASP